MLLIDDVKKHMRISHSKSDDEINSAIAACMADLELTGITKTDDNDPLIRAAIKFYCDSHVGYNSNADKYQAAYDKIKDTMSLTQKYTGRE